MVIGASNRFPEISRRYFENGANTVAIGLAAFLDRLKSKGLIDVDDTKLAAKHFLGLLRQNAVFRAMLDPMAPEPTDTQLDEWTKQAVDIFLTGVTSGKADTQGVSLSAQSLTGVAERPSDRIDGS